jgi:hypothetical protein
MHVQFQNNPNLFDPVNVWYGTENGQAGGGIEDEGPEYRWFMMSLKP